VDAADWARLLGGCAVLVAGAAELLRWRPSTTRAGDDPATARARRLFALGVLLFGVQTLGLLVNGRVGGPWVDVVEWALTALLIPVLGLVGYAWLLQRRRQRIG
jgi:hypothetical protein